MQQHLRNVNLDRTDLVARSAQGGSIREGFSLLHAHQLRCENSPNGTGVDRAIGMTARAGIDRANIETGTATDTVQRLTTDLVSKDVSTSVVEQHQVERLWAISRRYPCPQAGVGIHPFACRTAWQQLQEDRKVLKGGQDFLDAHHRNERLRQRQAHASIALTLDDADRSALGDGEVGTAHRHLSREELLAQVAPCGGGKLLRIVGEVLPLSDRATEEVADLAAILMDGGNQDMGGRLSGQLNDQFGKVGLNGTDTCIC